MTDPQPFLTAATMLEAGLPVEDAYAELTPEHKDILFHTEKRPPLPILVSAGKDAPALLRKLADELKDEA